SAEVAYAMQREGSTLRAALPGDLMEALDKPRLQHAIGSAFGHRVETRFDSRRLVRAGTHARAVRWAVASDPEPAPDPGESVSHGESVAARVGGNAGIVPSDSGASLARGVGRDSPGLTDSPESARPCYRLDCGQP